VTGKTPFQLEDILMHHVPSIRRAFFVLSCLALALTLAPSTYAASPNKCGTSCPATAGNTGITQDATWLAAKYAFRVRSGVAADQPKGTASQSYIVSGVQPLTYPSSYELSISNHVPDTYEPSDGTHSNFCLDTSCTSQEHSHTDDNNKSYIDGNFFDLCGPGAADVALYYWPYPPNYGSYANVLDPKTGVSTTWNGSDIDVKARMRGYLASLAWQLQILKPDGTKLWAQPGMMEQYAPGGVTLQTERDSLNWEASSENTSTWQNYFYVVMWWNQFSSTDLHNDVQSDLYNSHVPVVAEVNAYYMPNWDPLHTMNPTNHYITIIGYNDSNGTYQYTDTCGRDTNCGSLHDATIQNATQSQMWNAITKIPVNQGTGDGGWIW
jgi:hypothetical protein